MWPLLRLSSSFQSLSCPLKTQLWNLALWFSSHCQSTEVQMVFVICGPGCPAGTLTTGPGHIFTKLGSQPWLERRQRGGGRACAELVWVIAAGSLRWPAATGAGFVTSAPLRQQVQTGGEGGRLCRVREGTGSQQNGPSQPGLLGACPLWCGCWGNLLVKLLCVSP